MEKKSILISIWPILSFAFLSSAQATYSPIRNLFAFCNMIHSSSSSGSGFSWSWDRCRLSGCLSISLSKPMRFQKRGEHDPKLFTLLNWIECTLSVAGWSIDLNQEDPRMRYATSRQLFECQSTSQKISFATVAPQAKTVLSFCCYRTDKKWRRTAQW